MNVADDRWPMIRPSPYNFGGHAQETLIETLSLSGECMRIEQLVMETIRMRSECFVSVLH